MLLKKFKHDELLKFCVMIESKAWGKAGGSDGGEEGIVGNDWDAADEAVGIGADDDDVVAWGSGSLFHFEWSEINPCHERREEEAKGDFCTSLVEKPPYTVNAIRMNGIRITAHRKHLPVRCFVCSEFRSSVGGIGMGTELLNPSVLDGWGEGGGVNITLTSECGMILGNECAWMQMSVMGVQCAAGSTKEICGRATLYADDEY